MLIRRKNPIINTMSAVTSNDESYNHAGPGSQTLGRLENAGQYNRWIASLILPYLGRRNLEIGAGRGTIARIIASDRLVDVLEPAKANGQHLYALQHDQPNIGEVFCSPAEIPKSYQYNCIYSSNVLEHIYDDKGELEKYLCLLPSGGKILGIVPAGGKMLYSRFDRLVGHFRRYSISDRRRLQYLTDSDGRRAVLTEYKYLNPIGAFGWFLMMKLGARTDIPQTAIRRSQQFLPLSRVLSATKIPIGQSLLILWEKE